MKDISELLGSRYPIIQGARLDNGSFGNWENPDIKIERNQCISFYDIASKKGLSENFFIIFK